MAIMLLVRYTDLCRASKALEHRRRLVELLTIGVLVILILYASLLFQI